jgi:hypothetical protein
VSAHISILNHHTRWSANSMAHAQSTTFSESLKNQDLDEAIHTCTKKPPAIRMPCSLSKPTPNPKAVFTYHTIPDKISLLCQFRLGTEVNSWKRIIGLNAVLSGEHSVSDRNTSGILFACKWEEKTNMLPKQFSLQSLILLTLHLKWRTWC